jgi:hypothetical protein
MVPQFGGRAGLIAPAIDVLALQLTGLDSLEAVYIDGGNRRAVGHFPVGEALDAAGAAEQVLDRLPVEQVLGHFPFPGVELKIFPWRECEYEPHALATGAVAGNGVVKIDIDLVADGAALAAAFVVIQGHDDFL